MPRPSLNVLLCALAAFCAITSPGTCAQTSYPNRPIRLVVSSAAGGTGDTMARAVSRQVERELNTTIVIDNRPGATGVIANDTVAKSEPNGYTLAHTSSSLVTNASLGRKLPYDPLKDFAPVANLAMAESYLLLVNASLPVNSVKELIAFAKTRNLLYGTPGTGSSLHFTAEAFNFRAGTTMTSVPYKALAPALIAVVSGEVQVIFAPPLVTKALVTSGKLRALGSVSANRASSMPDVPTMQELGFKGFTLLGGWQGWFAAARTPEIILGRLHAAVAKAVKSDELRGFMEAGGYVPDGRSRAEFREQMISDYQQFKELARRAGIKDE